MGKCGLGAGRGDKECAHTVIEEHLECGCECDIIREECESASHRFRPELCECECRDHVAKQECLDKGKSWSDQTCSCGCPRDQSCPEGSRYDSIECICVPKLIEITEKTLFGDLLFKDVNVINKLMTREIIVVILLLVINMCLILIVTLLCSRLFILKTVFKNASLTNANDDYL